MSFIGLGVEKQVGDYVLNELLIEGPIAQIYQGTHIPTGEKVAIKVFNKIKLHSVPNDLMKAEKEISILRKMFHKNIIKLYEIMETAQRIYLVMEFCEGGDLFNYILTRGHLTERQSCKFFHEIIEALTYLHSQQIAHRDIKPENLLLNTTGKSISLKLIDFGVGNNYDDKILHTSCGTSAFAAPEMFTGENYNGLLCDIWSAGIVLYAMAFGYLPFGDENEQSNINNIINGNFEIPDEANDDLRDLLVNIIETNPNKRFNLEQIKAHKWYNIINNTSIPGIIINKHKIPIDDRIISVCQAYGFTQDNLIQSVTENVYDNNASIYYIILNKFIRERFDSVSDLFSQDYLDYINNPINLINYSKNNENEKNKNNETNRNNENNDNNINHSSFYSEKSDNNNENNQNNQNNESNENNDNTHINDKNHNNSFNSGNSDNNNNNKNNNINDKNHNISFNSDNSDNTDKNENNNINDKNHNISFNSENSDNNNNKDNNDNNDKNEKYENNPNNNEYNNNKSYNSSNNKNKNENIYSNDNSYNNNTNEINNKDDKGNSEKESNNNDSIKSNNNIEIKDESNDVAVDEKKNDEIEDEMVNDNDDNNKETKNENKNDSSADNNEYSLECSINNDNNNLRRSEDDDYFAIKIKIKKKEVKKDMPETKEKKINNDINESTEDFQINNIFTESEQNNNLRNSNYNENQKNEIFSSLSELSPKGNLDNNSDEANNDLIIKNQNKNLIEKINNINKEEQINKIESIKEGKPKPKVKMQITNMSIFIQPTYKNQIKNKSTDKKDINNNKNKQTKKFIKNYNNILQNKNIRKKIYNNKIKENEIKNKKNIKINNNNKINNIYNNSINKNNNQKNKVKNYTIITNRNSSAVNRKLYHNYLSTDKKNNNKINNSNSKHRKLKDISYRKLDKIKNYFNKNNFNKSNIKKRNNINTDRNKTAISKQFKSGMFQDKPDHSITNRIYKNQLTKNHHFNNNSIDINSLMKNTKSHNLNYSSYIKNKDNHKQNNNYSPSKLSNNKSLNVKMHLIFKSALNKNNSCKDNSQIAKKIDFRKMILNSNQNKSFSNHRLRRSNRQKNHNNIINNRNYNTILNDLYLFNEKSKSSNKKLHNKSFELNINRENKEKKENNLKNVNKEWEKSLYNIKINNYNPKLYKGPIDLKHLITSYKIDDIFKEIITFLNKNEIHFNWEKNNKCRLLCNKNEEMFEIEIFSIYNKTIENKASNKLYYFLYISKAKHKLFLKSYLDALNKLLLEKFGIKNFCTK